MDENYDLTPLGHLVARLPLEPRLARMLIIGCIMKLGDATATIASNISLSSEVFDIGKLLLTSEKSIPMNVFCKKKYFQILEICKELQIVESFFLFTVILYLTPVSLKSPQYFHRFYLFIYFFNIRLLKY